jgi:hypothetical protein
MNSEQKTKTVLAPSSGSADSPAQIISVQIHDDEEVLWQWTHYPNGISAVTGYEVIKKVERSKE